jgi:hypothetical protein
MKLTIMGNYGLKAISLKFKNADRWGKIQRNAQCMPGIEGLD